MGTRVKPRYLALAETGELRRRGDLLWQHLTHCHLCPRACGVNRLSAAAGFCGATAELKVSSFHPHFGEEAPLVGHGGSGTIFFSHCALRCVFCINDEISHGDDGQLADIEQLVTMMLALQKMGCSNINVVTPTHYAPHILLALDMAARQGLDLPLVYNTCGWEHVEILNLLDGVVDIYLADFKYADGNMAATYSAGAESYPELTQSALLEMQRQVGVAKPAKDGRMYRGLMIRHLVMPNNTSSTDKVMSWIAKNLPRDTYVNLMSQYYPACHASDDPDIARRITRAEYTQAVAWAKEAGLTQLDIQGIKRWS